MFALVQTTVEPGANSPNRNVQIAINRIPFEPTGLI
jgi:hypothetical protein